ncbi:MAG: nuclear transport factor 2 family protein [Desulfobacterales bacterium]|nr:nuclear transport factor 2 family protein [Desulfobacterales bacterium]
MKKLATVSILIVLAALWTYPGQAREVVYFAPDGSKITRAEYDRLADKNADAYQRSKKTWSSKAFKKSSRRVARSSQKSGISEIRESDIRNISKRMIESSSNRDLNGMIAYLAPSFTVRMQTSVGELSLTRAEYVALLNETWPAIRSYRVNIESQKVTVARGKQKAINEVTLVENSTLVNGMAVKVRTHQKSVYEIVDGKILITSTEAVEETL